MTDISDPIVQLQPNAIVQGSLFPEPVQVITTIPMGGEAAQRLVKLIGKGLRTNQVYETILSPEQLASLRISPVDAPYNGSAARFRLGIEALRLGLAYEYDPYFSLSIARIDPLPHQLEAVYDYFLKLPRIRFLLADDPGAGKTIMAGLLIKELKIRGLVKRVLIVTPANLTFQWQRELKDKFREPFEVVRSDVLRANYGVNPWQDRNQVITSVSWVSRVDDARDSLLRSHWDLIIVDESHKMSAYSEDRKTLAYRLGEQLSEMTDHFLLMTATPHKGDPKNFTLFLELLDRDVYGDVASLEEAMRRNEAPFYLRRVKEAMVTFPDPDSGKVKQLFTKRNVQTSEFRIDAGEWDFYNALTHYVEDQSIKAAADNSPHGRALGFTMAMLQRRFASSVYAVRRSLERMRDRRQKILDDPEAYRQEQIAKKLPEDFDDLPEEEQEALMDELEAVAASVNPADLRIEIAQLGRLIQQALLLEQREVESKLACLKTALTEQGLFSDPQMKLLIFTEHKDTLDYLAGDGKGGRPLGKLLQWGLRVTQIHGGMKIGSQDEPGTRLYAEREFKKSCQVMVATEAAGEGINLQFCWFMINYDIPWNPVRLEQRMGRIHRYGQEKDCLIFNFVSTNTREGSVLTKLFERLQAIEDDLDPQRTGKIFNVLGDVFPSNQLERMLRDLYAHNLTEEVIKSRIIEQVDAERFRKITHSTLEGLAKRELNLSAIVGKSAAARERRLVPEVIEDFFLQAGPLVGIHPKDSPLPGRGEKPAGHIYRVGKTPRGLWAAGERLEARFGALGKEYGRIAFDKKLFSADATLEWITPGHPLFEAVREETLALAQADLTNGAVFYDLHRRQASRLDVFSAAIRDGRGHVLHRRLFVMETPVTNTGALDGSLTLRQPTLFLDLSPAPPGVKPPDALLHAAKDLPNAGQVEQALVQQALHGFLEEVASERRRQVEVVSRHTEISLNALIDKVQCQYAGLEAERMAGSLEAGLEGRMKIAEDRLDELNERLERRRAELKQEAECTISDVQRIGRAWALPHPERQSPTIAPLVRDDEIERIAVQEAIRYEASRGWVVESVEKDNRGFDLISRRMHAEDPQTAVEVRFIEVKGRAGMGDVLLSDNEWKTAQRLGDDYWLYVVYHCAAAPQLHTQQNPARLEAQPVMAVAHYKIKPDQILEQG